MLSLMQKKINFPVTYQDTALKLLLQNVIYSSVKVIYTTISISRFPRVASGGIKAAIHLHSKLGCFSFYIDCYVSTIWIVVQSFQK